jgi:hypothetical protein
VHRFGQRVVEDRDLAHEGVGPGVDHQLDPGLVGGGAEGADVVGVLLYRS